MLNRRHISHIALALLTIPSLAMGGQTRAPSARQPNPQAVPALSPQEIFKHVSPSVMVVESLDEKGSVSAFGSGVVIASGRVVTNRHVIEDGVSYTVEHNGKKWPAKLVRVDPDHDLAELSVAGLEAPAVTVRDSSKLAVGEKVYAIGAPEGLELTISEGLISGLRDFERGQVIQTSAAISPGSSGGGLFDAQGRLVGITTFYLKEGQSLNFALPAEWTLALDRHPTNPAPATTENTPTIQALVWLMLGYTEYKAGKYSAAVDAYKQAIRLKPDYAAAWDLLGIAYCQLGKYDKAVSAFQEVIQLKPNDEPAWAGLGLAYNSLFQYDKAVSALRQAIRLKPDLEPVWVQLGIAYFWLKQHKKELNAELEAIRLKPDDGLAWRYLGLAYDGLGEVDKAISAERRDVQLEPGEPGAWFVLGLALKENGQELDVMKVYEKLKILDPTVAEEFFKAAVLP